MTPSTRNVLFAWVGDRDLKAAGVPRDRRPLVQEEQGPIAAACDAEPFGEVVLLADCAEAQREGYRHWLQERLKKTQVTVRPVTLASPTDYRAIHAAAREAVDAWRKDRDPSGAVTFHLSPGTPAMATTWVVLAKAWYGARMIQSSPEAGVVEAEVPFDLAAEVVPTIMSERDAALERRAEKLQASFAEIAHQSEVMRRLLEQAQRVAVRSVPVLLEGETGTGKDLLAEAIHKASPRRTGPFVAVNCGAIPEGLQESELFGHEKGAFTHATGPHRGYFEQAHRGTLFLDEVGELPLGAQVKLLRALQNRVVRRVGAEKDLPVDVRIVTATHRDLAARVRGGAFREDLYYRLAVLPLRVPALRDRHGDVKHLVEVLLHKQNEEFRRLGEEEKTLSVRARNVLYRHPWPGNVRELQAVLLRAAVLARGTAISDEDAREALGTSPLPAAPVGAKVAPAEEDYALRPGFSLPKELERVARGYLARAMKETGGNKAQATKLLGLASYQTLSNWLAKYKVKG